ncbi:hypothetical protein DDF62_03760 [Caulobacter radicis]|nr:hypothetical protein DDF62_03760 [Caulobacter radicis]
MVSHPTLSTPAPHALVCPHARSASRFGRHARHRRLGAGWRDRLLVRERRGRRARRHRRHDRRLRHRPVGAAYPAARHQGPGRRL